jgi:thioredoxin reductase
MKYARVIIAGAGPAGIACAVQLTRMGMNPLVVEKGRTGGMVHNANLIENYPGFPEGVGGEQLRELLEKHLERFEINLIKDEIRLAEYSAGLFTLSGLDDRYQCVYLVVATGTAPVLPKLFTSELIRSGLVHTDISKLRSAAGKCIGIIGAGDAAFDYSLSLSRQGNEIRIFNRTDRVRALQILQERTIQNVNISYHPSHELSEASMTSEGTIRAIFNTPQQRRDHILDYLIFATGRVPALDFLDEELKANTGHLIGEGRLFLAGDVKNGIFRQVSAAVGDGVRAAMEIFRHEHHQ